MTGRLDLYNGNGNNLANASEVVYRDIYTKQGKINACKEYKAVMGCDLLTAKQAIERMAAKYGWKTPDQQKAEPYLAVSPDQVISNNARSIRRHRKQIEGAAKIMRNAGLPVPSEIEIRCDQLRKDEVKTFLDEISSLNASLNDHSEEGLRQHLMMLAPQFRTFANE